MIAHTYRFHLDSPLVRLSNVDDLLGKDVEITVRELPAAPDGNAERLSQFLAQSASSSFFSNIDEPAEWQKRLRDEWE
ncbi:hypothetical protein ACAW74_11870 [Fibrella sp. WM1]|uniref:hypothetical protein n=1 Tax=Fibrella musci TaxID=3242485 RepID=UPI003521E2ED